MAFSIGFAQVCQNKLREKKNMRKESREKLKKKMRERK